MASVHNKWNSRIWNCLYSLILDFHKSFSTFGIKFTKIPTVLTPGFSVLLYIFLYYMNFCHELLRSGKWNLLDNLRILLEVVFAVLKWDVKKIIREIFGGLLCIKERTLHIHLCTHNMVNTCDYFMSFATSPVCGEQDAACLSCGLKWWVPWLMQLLTSGAVQFG